MRWWAVGVLLATPALAESPAPEFYVEAIAQESIARLLSQNCENLDFHHGGFERHLMELTGRLSDMRIHPRSGSKFAPIPPFRMQRQTDAFLAKHGLTANSSEDAFCAAGEVERVERTPIGLMLRQPG